MFRILVFIVEQWRNNERFHIRNDLIHLFLKNCFVESGKVWGKNRHSETSLEAISVIPARDDSGLDYRGCKEQETLRTIEGTLKSYKTGYRRKEGVWKQAWDSKFWFEQLDAGDIIYYKKLWRRTRLWVEDNSY